MDFRLVNFGALTPRDVQAWSELAEDALEANAFFAPEFVLPAARGLGAESELRLAVLSEAGDWVAALPASVGRWRGRIPAISAWRHSYGFLGTPLVRSGDGEGRVDALVSGLLTASRRDVVAFERLGDGAVSRAVATVTERTRLVQALDVSSERALVCRRPEPDYLAGLPPHRRRELSRLRRRLSETLQGDVETRDATAEAGAVERFLELERSGWKGRNGTALASDPRHAAMFSDLCERFADARRLELLEMHVGEQLVAVKCNLRSGEGAFAFKIAFDEELARFSPGVQLEVDNLSFFHAGTARYMDSCADPDNQMINRLWPDRRMLRSIVLAAPGLTGSTARAALSVAKRVRRHRERSSA